RRPSASCGLVANITSSGMPASSRCSSSAARAPGRYKARPAATAYAVNSDTSITATSPAGQAGAVDVTVITAGGTSATNANDQYTYTPPAVPTVTKVSPGSGPSTGGTSVTITRTAFTGAPVVNFGPGNPAKFSVTNDATI